MTQMIEVYTSPASATPAPSATPARGLSQVFPWLAASSSGSAEHDWFWAPGWQEGEREVDRHIAAGETTVFDSSEAFLAALEREIQAG
jgi:hypothetical protein